MVNAAFSEETITKSSSLSVPNDAQTADLIRFKLLWAPLQAANVTGKLRIGIQRKQMNARRQHHVLTQSLSLSGTCKSTEHHEFNDCIMNPSTKHAVMHHIHPFPIRNLLNLDDLWVVSRTEGSGPLDLQPATTLAHNRGCLMLWTAKLNSKTTNIDWVNI